MITVFGVVPLSLWRGASCYHPAPPCMKCMHARPTRLFSSLAILIHLSLSNRSRSVPLLSCSLQTVIHHCSYSVTGPGKIHPIHIPCLDSLTTFSRHPQSYKYTSPLPRVVSFSLSVIYPSLPSAENDLLLRLRCCIRDLRRREHSFWDWNFGKKLVLKQSLEEQGLVELYVTYAMGGDPTRSLYSLHLTELET